MAYTINLTDGTIFATVDAGTVNNASSMTLIGKNYAGYGQFLDNNFIHLLENSADTTAPSAPLTGQLWWDKTNALLKVYTGVAFKSISAATSSTTAPTNNVIGDFWYDTVNQQLKVWTGAAFLVIGPAFTSAEGISGAIPETINDSSATPHDVTSLYVDNERVAVVSKDANFTPAAPTVTTFPTIYTGITLTNSGSPVFAGSATNAQLLDSLDSTDFMRATANTSTTGTVKVLNNTGLFVGSANVFNVNISSNDARIKSDISTGNLIIQANVGGTTYDVAKALGSNGTFAVSNAITVGTTAVVTGNITGSNLITGGLITATGNIIGGNVNTVLVGATTLSATANVQGGNLRTTGVISSTGNITSAGNTTSSFFLGNGSQLTGLSLGVSVTKFVNGTTEGNIGAPNGNVTFTVGGVANVVVIDTGTLYANLSTPSIAKTGTNAIGNIGSLNNYFNQVFTVVVSATTLSATGNVIGGNVTTGGLISATGNITGGNVLGGANVNATTHTGTTVSVTGNITGGNVLGGANVNATTHTGTTVSVTGNITGGNVTTAGIANIGIAAITGAATVGTTLSVTGNVTGGNVSTANVNATTHTGTTVSVTGNITGGNVIATHFGSGAALSSLTGANVTGTVPLATTAGTAGTAGTVTTAAQGNITSVGTLTSLSATGNVTASYFLGNGSLLTGLVPSGMIMMWSGSVASIPSGWLLCNGTSGTPNLMDRMVIGAGSSYAVNATGGAATTTLAEANLPSHTHTYSSTSGTTSVDHNHTYSGTSSGQSVTHTHAVTDPGHAHAIDEYTMFGTGAGTPRGVLNDGGLGSLGTVNTGTALTGVTIGDASVDHTHTYSGTSAGANVTHTHSVSGTTAATGSGTAVATISPYYALAYVMKS